MRRKNENIFNAIFLFFFFLFSLNYIIFHELFLWFDKMPNEKTVNGKNRMRCRYLVVIVFLYELSTFSGKK